ncbi:MAG: GSCFA domain-containing protein [Mangrovibacterium sp.]
MNSYFTSVKIPNMGLHIDLDSRLMFMGSCFTDSIGSRFNQLKFPSLVNPFGVLYNPYSVANALKQTLEGKPLVEDDLFKQHGLYKSYFFHSRFNRSEAQEALALMDDAILQSHLFLQQTDVLFVTFGTAFLYQLEENGLVVANCHKQPSHLFVRKRMNVTEIAAIWNELLDELQAFNPNLKIVFTVSPIRHWKDGAHGNQLSKSSLLLAIDEIIANNSNCFYFPSYEIVMDELRDYRFYANDMLHLSEVAIEHIWQSVQSHLIVEKCHALLKQIARLNQATQHRIFNTSSEETTKFAATNLQLIAQLEQALPQHDFNKEKNYFRNINN